VVTLKEVHNCSVAPIECAALPISIADRISIFLTQQWGYHNGIPLKATPGSLMSAKFPPVYGYILYGMERIKGEPGDT